MAQQNRYARDREPGILVSDDELMARVAQNNTDAFRILVERWERPVFVFFERMVGSKEEAQDLGQETFIRVYQHARRYQPRGQFKSWLFRIAGNLARSQNRRNKIFNWIRFDAVRHDLPAAGETTMQALERSETRSAVGSALDRLPKRQREALVLRTYEGMTYQEIADSMNTSISAVESMLHRAMVALRKELLRKKVVE